jgi:hypothetical protein
MQAVDLQTPASVLRVLRGDPATRPTVDRALAGGLRAWLEDGIYDVSKGETRERPLILRIIINGAITRRARFLRTSSRLRTVQL